MKQRSGCGRALLCAIAVTIPTAIGFAQYPPAGTAVPGAPMGVTAFVDVAVVPMDTERVLMSQTVLVEAGRITALGPSAQIRVPAGAIRIGGRGHYLIPGLADMHTHVSGVSAFGTALNVSLPPDSIVEHRLFLLLADGVTTIRNMDHGATTDGKNRWFLNGREMLALRHRAAAGEILSPRIYTAGPWAPMQYRNSPTWLGRFAPELSFLAPNLDSVPAYVAAYKAAGYDFLKVRNEASEVWAAVLSAAREANMPVVGHVHGPLEVALAGMTSLEHMQGYGSSFGRGVSAEEVQTLALAARRAGVWLCPNMQLGTSGPPGLLKAFQAAGGGILLGTDIPLGGRVHGEFERLVSKAGLTPYEALATGTRNVAAYFGTADETGTIAVGKRADLLLLNGNPLEDIGNTEQLAGVMIGGRWLSRPALDRRVEAIEVAGGVWGRSWRRRADGQPSAAESKTSPNRSPSR